MKIEYVVVVATLAVAVTACSRSKSDYERCLEIDATSSYGDAAMYCRKAAADVNSEWGKAAAVWLDTKEHEKAARDLAASEHAKAAQHAVDAMAAKYMTMTAGGRETALVNCFDETPRCAAQEMDVIVKSAGDDEEKRSLQRVIEFRAPTMVSFDDLKKLAATGMQVGKPYGICSFYYPNDASQFCKLMPGTTQTCAAYLTVGDNFATGTDEKKALYDRREKTSCFEVRMFSNGELRITGFSGGPQR